MKKNNFYVVLLAPLVLAVSGCSHNSPAFDHESVEPAGLYGSPGLAPDEGSEWPQTLGGAPGEIHPLRM